MHDKIGVEDASIEIHRLIKSPPLVCLYECRFQKGCWLIRTLTIVNPQYGPKLQTFFGGVCSFCIALSAFQASFIDMLLAFALGALLIAAQVYIATSTLRHSCRHRASIFSHHCCLTCRKSYPQQYFRNFRNGSGKFHHSCVGIDRIFLLRFDHKREYCTHIAWMVLSQSCMEADRS